MKIYIVLITCITLLSGCTVRADFPNRMIIDSEGVTIDSKGHKHSGTKNFCPPGQAKKGNC